MSVQVSVYTAKILSKVHEPCSVARATSKKSLNITGGANS